MLDPASYSSASVLFVRLLGLIYLFAFGAFLFQIRGLIGVNGILPLKTYLNFLATYHPKKKFFYAPTILWMSQSNFALMGLVVAGCLISICLMAGLFPALCLLSLYLLYLSLVSAGQDFLGFGWEGFLLEITAHAFFISLTTVPCLMIWWSLNFLLFRFHLQAGAVKLQSCDPSWKDLTAIAYHYQSQPLPNSVAWYAHKLPLWFQKFSVYAMFFIEMVVPFGIFLSADIRFATFIALVGLQYGIWLTGNFSFLNYLTAVLCIILLSNDILSPLMTAPQDLTPSIYLVSFINSGGFFLLGIQCLRLWHNFFGGKILERFFYWISPFHLANRYGIFAVMTRERYEVVIEGSEDGQHWKEYLFRYKPSEVTRRPRRIAPYQPRIDWQAWFLPFSDYTEKWFQNFLVHLLKGTPDVLSLLRENPFSQAPPRYIRSLIYEYTFTSVEEKRKNGAWWKRSLIGEFSPTLYLDKKQKEPL